MDLFRGLYTILQMDMYCDCYGVMFEKPALDLRLKNVTRA